MKELCELFTVEKVNSSPAKFDMKKLEAINGDKIRALTNDEFLNWSLPFLIKSKIISGTPDEIALVKAALPIIQERIIMFSEIPAMLKFLFVEKFEIEADSIAKVTDSGAKDVLRRALKELEPISDWSQAAIEGALRTSLIDELGLKPRIAFGAVRIATTGSSISPPLFESLELLGKVASLARISAALTL